MHGARARRSTAGEKLGNPNKRWTDEIRPRREAILRPLEAFRAAGHKSLEARVRVTPGRRRAAALAVEPGPPGRAVRRVARRARRGRRAAGARPQIVVDEAPGPDLPALLAAHRRGRRAPAPPIPNLCLRCAGGGRDDCTKGATRRERPSPQRPAQVRPVHGLHGHQPGRWISGPRCWRARTCARAGRSAPRWSSRASSTCATPRTRASRSACCRTSRAGASG